MNGWRDVKAKNALCLPVIGLEYLPDHDDQPLITIKAESSAEASMILHLARKHKIPMVEDPVLAEQLSVLNEGWELPAQLFKAVGALFNEIDKILSVAR